MIRLYLFILCLFSLTGACRSKEMNYSDAGEELFFHTAEEINAEIISDKYTLLNVHFDSVMKINQIISNISHETKKDTIKKEIYTILSSWERKGYILYDNDYLVPSFLLAQDSLALLALSKASWRNTVTVGDFVEYVLPYKQDMELVDGWRDTLFSYYSNLVSIYPSLVNLDSLYLYHKINTYPSLSKNIDIKYLFPSQDNFSWLNFCNEGDCIARCLLMIYHLRAAGAPATMDYIPAWGNRPYAKHAYVGLANRKIQVKKLLENSNDPYNVVNDLNGCMTDTFMFIFPKKDIPEGLYIQYEKTIPKVYRSTWSIQEDVIDVLNKVSDDEIHSELTNPNRIDVTNQYLKTADVELELNLPKNRNIVYLSVFDKETWRPVAYALKKNKRIIFKHMGKNIVYIATYKENQNFVPLTAPFILGNDGKIKFLTPDFTKKRSINLHRKYPLFAYSASYTKPFKNSTLIGGVSNDYLDFENIYKITEYPFLPLTIKLNPEKKYKFIRLQTEKKEKARTNLFDCYTIDPLGQETKIEGEIIRINGVLQINFAKTTTVSKITIWPRNDENFVVKGNTYELMFWDKGWKSLGIKKADNYYISYDNVPSNTLFWLKCLTEGKEERIFTYEKGMQIWW